MEMLVVTIACGIAVVLITYAVLQEWQREKMMRGNGSGLRKGSQVIVDWLAHRIGSLLLGRARRYLASRCLLAGFEDSLDPERVIARAIIISVLFMVFYIWWSDSLSYASVIIANSLGCGFVGGRLLLRARARKAEVERALPTVMDMLTLSVEAGLDFGQAISRITTASKTNALTRELERLIAELKLGVGRADALARMAKRIRVPSLDALALTLIQADRFGAPIGPTLRSHAQRVRGERMMRAEKAGAMAAQKALIPLIVCIMPVTFIVVFGPLVARYLTGGFDHLFR